MGGVISFGGKEKALSSDCVAAPEHSKLAAKEPSASLIQSCGLSRLRLVNQRIGFLRFAAAVDLHGVWHGWEVSGCGER